MGSRSPSPEPPETSRGLWAGQDGPKRREERPKSRQNRPKRRPGALPAGPSAAQERFRSGLAGRLAPNCPPKSSPRPPGGYFGSLGARFQTLRGPRPLKVHPSGEHLPLLLGLSTARPQKSIRLQNAKSTTPPRGHWLTNEVGGMGGAILTRRIQCLKNNGHNKLQAAM